MRDYGPKRDPLGRVQLPLVGQFAERVVPTLGVGAGDKAGELAAKREAIETAGFVVPSHFILGESWVRDVLTRAEIDPHEGIVRGQQNDFRSRLLQAVSEYTDKVIAPMRDKLGSRNGVVIRSSARGDSRGTGIYRSEFTTLESRRVVEAIVQVIESYLDSGAVAYRRKGGLPDEFAIFTVPVIGEVVNYRSVMGEQIHLGYAPALSGYAYTDSREGRFLLAARGLAIELMQNPGLGFRGTVKKGLDLDAAEREGRLGGSFGTEARIFDPTLSSCIGVGRITTPLPERARLLDFIIDHLDLLERACAKPQYVEWAIEVTPHRAIPYIVQIADVVQRADISAQEFLLQTHEGTLLEASLDVVGSGRIKVKQVAYIFDIDAMEGLSSFNAAHPEGYLLLTEAQILSSMRQGNPRYSFDRIGNVASIVSIPTLHQHFFAPSAHLMGAFDSSRILFGAVESPHQFVVPPQLRRLLSEGRRTGFAAIDLAVEVVADEKVGRLIVV